MEETTPSRPTNRREALSQLLLTTYKNVVPPDAVNFQIIDVILRYKAVPLEAVEVQNSEGGKIVYLLAMRNKSDYEVLLFRICQKRNGTWRCVWLRIPREILNRTLMKVIEVRGHFN